MTTYRPSEEAVEAAAKAIYLTSPADRGRFNRQGIWRHMPEATKNSYRSQARAAISAATGTDHRKEGTAP